MEADIWGPEKGSLMSRNIMIGGLMKGGGSSSALDPNLNPKYPLSHIALLGGSLDSVTLLGSKGYGAHYRGYWR